MTQTDVLVTNEVVLNLEELLKKLGTRNYIINISAGTIKGDNFLGVIAKVQVTGETATGEHVIQNFIVKSAPRNENFRMFAPVHAAYEREIYIYSKVLPAFLKLQNDRGIQNPFRSYAKYYDSSVADMNEALIMEDMKEYGFKLHDRHRPLDYNHTLLVLREYGKFHALSFALRDQEPKIFAELAEETQENFFNGMNSTELHNSFQSQSERALNALHPITHKFAHEKFKKFQNNMTDVINAAVKSDLSDPYSVIGHGDCWINNFLFKYDDTNRVPLEMCILDWQLARLGSPALDLGYFLFTCTSKELRDEKYNSLIQEYYKSFRSFLKELGSDADKLFPFDVLQEHLKKYCVYGLCMAVIVLLILISDTEEIPDIHNISSNEHVMDKLNYEPKNIEVYNSRVRDIIFDFIKLGYNF
ncbi:hypothetical protein PPYR_03777 [Photinus pyralis]|uniref:CHK kinase-like domain-containing protein n=3 Tax=Photinus pyralis TaxID=7054 RepID=A0A5N4AW80_PHOPY|nr:uncharacterized protein LOC116165182 [Photinus pyralis]KAB0801591.1 hypothetical protein PPYR_03777 [Photinus pyralis]